MNTLGRWAFVPLTYAVAMFVGCGDDDHTGPSSPPDSRVMVHFVRDSLDLVQSQSVVAIQPSVTAPNGKSLAVTWGTRCSTVALSSTGGIKALSPGTCKIVATSVADPFASDTLYVTIYAPLFAKMSPATLSVKKGQTVDFAFTLTSGLPGAAAKGGVCFIISPEIATVTTGPGNICRVKGWATGTTQVGFKSNAVDPVQGYVEASSSVIVVP